MWLLGRSLPLLIGSLVSPDDEYWKNFCLFLNIAQHLFAPSLTENDLAVLQENISIHHHQFISLYPSNTIIPKLHYLIHMPRLIYMFVRFEAKHKYFKDLANITGNFINIPLTLSMRHQYLQCYLDNPQPEFTKGVNMTSSGLPYLKDLIENGPDVFSTYSVKVNGIMYKTKAVLATKPAIDYEEPSFGQIREIYVVNSSVYFYVQALDTLDYSEHYCVYTALTIWFRYGLSPPTCHCHHTHSPGHFCIAPKFIIR